MLSSLYFCSITHGMSVGSDCPHLSSIAHSGPDRQETCKMALAVQLQSRGIWGRTRGKQGMDGEHGDVPNNGGQWCCV